MAIFLLSLRMLARSLRAGELRVLALAILVAVAAVSTVGFFAGRVEASLARQAVQMLGADLVVVSDEPLPAPFSQEARRLGLAMARSLSFPSMVRGARVNHLAQIRAVGAGYPLRGTVKIASAPARPGVAATGIPAPGTIWVEPRLLAELGAKVGDRVGLGDARFKIAAVLLDWPHAQGGFFSIAPHVLINVSDLARTGLIEPGSRVSYRLLLAGPTKSLLAFRRWAGSRMGIGERLEVPHDAERQVRSALAQARAYLALSAMVSVALAAVAVAIASRQFLLRARDGVAIARCLGATRAGVFRLYGYQYLWLAAAAGIVGVAVGYAGQAFLAAWLHRFVVGRLPAPSASTGLGAWLIGLALALSFGLPAVLQLARTRPLRVLRRERRNATPLQFGAYVLGFALVGLLLVSRANTWRAGAYVAAGFAGTVAVAALGAVGLIRLASVRRGHAGPSFLYGLASLRRRVATSTLQTVAFALGLMAILLLTLVRGDLERNWLERVPPDAPNRFIIGIQPDERDALQAFFAASRFPEPRLYPMVLGRLIAIDGRTVVPASYKTERARRLVEREFGLSSGATLRTGNHVVAGHWWTLEDTGKPLVSVEDGIAATLGIRLGDRLTFRIAGSDFTAQVASLRHVQWNSFQVNFFVVAAPAALQGFPTSYISALHVPPARAGLMDRMVTQFPGLTVVNVDALIRQVRDIMTRVAGAMEFIFAFTLAAGIAVLYGGIGATLDERIYEAAVLRVLGATRRQILAGQLAEFLLIGSFAGLLAALGASIVGYELSRHVLDIPYAVSLWVWVAGVLAGGLGVCAAALVPMARVLARPPMPTLHEGG
ncbi:MAG: FtsX-like permease family protein [Betaproteobacteria bacterium]|nr:FtsX-like permease family protein [Betaproteobacteria bacterium]